MDTRTLGLIDQLTKCKDAGIEWAKIRGKVAIVYSIPSIHNMNARLALAMSVNCLSRMSPVITELDVVTTDDTYSLMAPLFDENDVKTSIIAFTKKLRSKVTIKTLNHLEQDYDALLSIGTTEHSHAFKITVSSDGWLSYVSPNVLTSEFTSNVNPIGAYFAANLGCAEIFKKILVKKSNFIIPEKNNYDFRWYTKFIQNELIVNTFDYSINKKHSVNPSLPQLLNLGDIEVIGVGAGGGACLYTIASLQSIQGIIHIIDPDEVKHSNLNRYVYATSLDADHNMPKTEVTKQIFSKHPNCIIYPHHMSYLHYSQQLNSKPIELLISTVDTDKTRIDIQWDLPKIILDAAAHESWFYVDRVEFGKNACLGCRFYKEGSTGSEEIKLSKIIGLSPKVISDLRANNASIEQSHIDVMKPFSEKNKFTLPKLGEHFQDWFLYHCGEIHLDNESVIIPIPFATIMPGILLAGEVIKLKYFRQNRTSHFFSYDTFSASKNNIDELKQNEKCPICSKPATLNRYNEKHGIHG